jgi:hypothetical protein
VVDDGTVIVSLLNNDSYDRNDYVVAALEALYF